MEDANRFLALRHLMRLGAQVEVQLASPEWEPIKAVLIRAQDEAADALVKLTTAPTDRPDLIRDLQSRAYRYESLINWLREIIAEGREASRDIDEARAELLREAIGVEIDDETRQALGLKEQGPGSE